MAVKKYLRISRSVVIPSIDDVRGYDNSSNMKGMHQGVQVIFLK